jgi:tryptophan synthase alpha chain
VRSSAPATRFEAAFASHSSLELPGLIPYFTAGYPRRDDTVSLLLSAERAGCLAVEVGIPFSDPLADGPTIQRTGWRALQQGMTLPLALDQMGAARESGLELPLAVMTYVNPILSYGADEFARDAARCGADGVIVPDLPAGEARELRAVLHGAGLVLIPLVAPTTPAPRIARSVEGAGGFVYCVGVTGVTGARESLAPEALQLLDVVRTLTPLPRALGFGISKHAHLAELRGRAEAAVIGSALLDAIGESEHDPAAAADSFLREIQGAHGAAEPRSHRG